MSTRADIPNAILDYIEGVLASGAELDVTAAAFHISSEFPQSGFHIQRLCEMIECAALRRGLPLSKGDKRSA